METFADITDPSQAQIYTVAPRCRLDRIWCELSECGEYSKESEELKVPLSDFLVEEGPDVS